MLLLVLLSFAFLKAQLPSKIPNLYHGRSTPNGVQVPLFIDLLTFLMHPVGEGERKWAKGFQVDVSRLRC